MRYNNISEEYILETNNNIAELFNNGTVAHTPYLRIGREYHMISCFKNLEIKSCDYVFGGPDIYDIALLKGVSKEELIQKYQAGLTNPFSSGRNRLYSSVLPGSLFGVAIGLALSLKKRNVYERVFVFCEPPADYMGIFFESLVYSFNCDLPIKFIVSSGGPTGCNEIHLKRWKAIEPWYVNTRYNKRYIYYFTYKTLSPYCGTTLKGVNKRD